MKCKRIFSLLLLSTCIIGGASGFLETSANAKIKDDTTNQSVVISDTNNKGTILKVANGEVVVTSRSGANIRKGPGTEYSRISPAARYGEVIEFLGHSEIGSDGRLWHEVEWQGKTGWISSAVSQEQ